MRIQKAARHYYQLNEELDSALHGSFQRQSTMIGRFDMKWVIVSMVFMVDSKCKALLYREDSPPVLLLPWSALNSWGFS